MANVSDPQSTIQMFEQMMGMSLVSSLISEIPNMLISIAVYVFTALALHTIAKRRGINNPWLAWIPFANTWLLGCISDQYRALARGETKYRRRVLLITEIITSVLAAVVGVMAFSMLINMLSFAQGNLENLDSMSDAMSQQLLGTIAGPAVGMVLFALVLLPVAIVHAVFGYIALHDIYKSCDPGNATLFLVLSILIGYAQPIFLFLCRNKDFGMPMRQAPQPVYQPYQPVYEQPTYAQPATPPAEPWEQKEE